MAVAGSQTILRAVCSALLSEARVDLRGHPLAMEFTDGALTLEGEVADVAAKKLALERAAAVPGVTGIVDRLRVARAERMGDGRLRDLVRDALLQEPAFADFSLRERVKGAWQPARLPPQPRGAIDLEVADGAVTLNGRVPGLDDKRLAGVLAWWVPGSRDVVNGLVVDPPETDSDDAIAEGVRLALEKDPFVDAGQIRVGVRHAVVRLVGLVRSGSERDMAELDAWYVFGVDKVVNRIEVHV